MYTRHSFITIKVHVNLLVQGLHKTDLDLEVQLGVCSIKLHTKKTCMVSDIAENTRLIPSLAYLH